MADSFFGLPRNQTSTRLRISDPTTSEIEIALTYGAVSRTINPMYCISVIRRDAEFVRALIRDCLSRSMDDDPVVDLFQRRLTPHQIPFARLPVTKVARRMRVF
jgi:hypothetical protein